MATVRILELMGSLINFCLHLVYRVLNYAHSVAVPSITGGPLGSVKYVLQGVRIKFGLDDFSGTEHALNGVKYAIEVQYAFSSLTGDTAMMVVLFQTNDTGIQIPPEPLNGIVQPGSSYTVSPFTVSLDKEIPPDGSLYAYYRGSDTKSPCTPNLSWFVLLQVVPVDRTTVRISCIYPLALGGGP